MKKLLFSVMVLSGVVVNAQYEKRVGINTETPRASLEVKAVNLDGRTQGILFPHISETEKNTWATDNTKGLVEGTVIWNTTKNCLDYFNGTYWTCTDGTKTNTHGVDWVKPISENKKWQDAPWMKLSNGVVNVAQTGFVPYDGTGQLPEVMEVRYMDWNDAVKTYGTTTTFAGGQYSLPTLGEWATILPIKYNYVNYATTTTHNDVSETNSLGTFTNDYKNMGGTITYALRFKENDDLKSAWKYEYIYGKGVKITIVNLKAIGQESTSTISTISNAFFWDSISSSTVINLFLPAYGNFDTVEHGQLGWFWSTNDNGEYYSACAAGIGDWSSVACDFRPKGMPYTMFLVRRN